MLRDPRDLRATMVRLRDEAVARLRQASPETLVTVGVVTAAVVFVFFQLSPSLLFKNTTPAGGDTGAHVWGPAYLRDHLFPHGRITGWAPSWYDGFPAFVFYFPLPAVLIALLSFILPYGVAFKLVTVLGVLSLPVAAYAFGKLSGMRFPGPAVLAVATVPFLFDRSFDIYGGNIPSTLAGEFTFSISLSLALLFLGVLARGLDTGRHRALAGILLALTGLSHMLPTLFALAGAAVLLLLRPDRDRLKFTATILGVGGLLAAFWTVPFLFRLPYANNMGWGKITEYQKNLLPPKLLWLELLAGAGVIVAIVYRRRTGLTLVGLAAVSGVVFVVAPESRLWNARALPFWYLCLYLLAGVALAEAGIAIARLVAADPDAPPRAAILATPAVIALFAWELVGAPLGVLPSWMPAPATRDSSYIPSWVKWNYSGYEGKTAYPEYKGIIDTMAEVGRTHGCGRANWEYEQDLNRFGTPMALMLLPYWTHECIGSMEGLYFESSATVPYHFLSAAELSNKPSDPMRDLPYPQLDVAAGIRHLQLLGTRYYLAFSPEALAQARRIPDLREIATTGRWHVFQVANSDMVSPLSYQPAVLTGLGGKDRSWLDASVDWYLYSSRLDVPLAASGPKEWPRVAVRARPTAAKTHGTGLTIDAAPQVPVTPATVSNIRAGDDHLSFDVDRIGSPVLVKASYFPNWHVSGATGPWRVTPNLMVVIPTSRHVSLHYGWTPVDLLGWLLTLAGLALVVLFVRAPPVSFRSDEDPAGEPFVEDDDVARPDDRMRPGRTPPPVPVPDRGG